MMLTRKISLFSFLAIICLGLAGCATALVENKYKGLMEEEAKRYETELKKIETEMELADIQTISAHIELAQKNELCKGEKNCVDRNNKDFIESLKTIFHRADFNELLTLCHNTCDSPRQLEYLVAVRHKNETETAMVKRKVDEEAKHENALVGLNREFEREKALAKERDRQTALAIAAGLQAYGQAMQQSAYQQSQSFSAYNSYPSSSYSKSYGGSYGSSSAFNTYSPAINFNNDFNRSKKMANTSSLGVVNVNRYDPDSLANPYGAGNPYKANGLMNPYSQYGSPYSNKSWTNPYATDAPKLYDSEGSYKGKLSTNPYDPDSVSNSYGRYGNPYSPDSIQNPYGAGNPYSTSPIYVVPSRENSEEE